MLVLNYPIQYKDHGIDGLLAKIDYINEDLSNNERYSYCDLYLSHNDYASVYRQQIMKVRDLSASYPLTGYSNMAFHHKHGIATIRSNAVAIDGWCFLFKNDESAKEEKIRDWVAQKAMEEIILGVNLE